MTSNALISSSSSADDGLLFIAKFGRLAFADSSGLYVIVAVVLVIVVLVVAVVLIHVLPIVLVFVGGFDRAVFFFSDLVHTQTFHLALFLAVAILGGAFAISNLIQHVSVFYLASVAHCAHIAR